MLVSGSRRTPGVYTVTTPSRAPLTVEAGAYDRPGEAAGPSPMELLLASLVTCAGSTFESVIAKMRFGLVALNVVADAERSEAVPRVFTSVTLDFHVASDAPFDRLIRAVQITERTCSASVMIGTSARIEPRVVEVRRVTAAETRPVRRSVLRPHQSLGDLAAEEDPAAVWFGALLDDEIVGTVSVGPESAPTGDGGVPYRLRSMATAPAVRGVGLGGVLLDAATAHVRGAGGDLIWCNARVPAAGFYRRAGFVEVSEEFDVPPIGPHVQMVLRL